MKLDTKAILAHGTYDPTYSSIAKGVVPKLCDRVEELEAAITQALALLANSGDAGSLAVITLRTVLGIPEGP
jgi:hypothetical protein